MCLCILLSNAVRYEYGINLSVYHYSAKADSDPKKLKVVHKH